MGREIAGSRNYRINEFNENAGLGCPPSRAWRAARTPQPSVLVVLMEVFVRLGCPSRAPVLVNFVDPVLIS